MKSTSNHGSIRSLQTLFVLVALGLASATAADPPAHTPSEAEADRLIAEWRTRFGTGNLMPRLAEWERAYPVPSYGEIKRRGRFSTLRGTVLSRTPLYVALGGRENQPVMVSCPDQVDQRDRCSRVRVGQQVAIASVTFQSRGESGALYPRAPAVLSVRLFSIHAQGWVEW
jgi:hypothetical protein